MMNEYAIMFLGVIIVALWWELKNVQQMKDETKED